MIDLEKLRERVSGLPDPDGAIGPTWCKPSEVLALLDYIAQLEKDAGRLDYIDRGNGSIRVDDDCGLTPEYIYFQKGSARQAIDTAMEAKHG